MVVVVGGMSICEAITGNILHLVRNNNNCAANDSNDTMNFFSWRIGIVPYTSGMYVQGVSLSNIIFKIREARNLMILKRVISVPGMHIAL